jgi:hypothetical protein
LRMYVSGRWDDGSRPSPYELMLRYLTEFPGPTAVACDPPVGSVELGGGESVDGLPFSVHVTYLVPGGPKLLVRTKAAPQPLPDPGSPHPPRTVDTLENAFGIYGHRSGRLDGPLRGASPAEHAAWRSEQMAAFRRGKAEFEALARTAVSIVIDGASFVGVRVDYPDCSGLEVDWNDQTVQCVSTAAALDALVLRSAADGDLQRICTADSTDTTR